jgi:CHAT domain-containing protein/tetratricopeptide (TPR) repeat protein
MHNGYRRLGLRTSQIIFFFLAGWFTCSGQHYEKLTEEAFDLANKKEYSKALELSQQLYEVFPDDIRASILCAFNLINLNRVDEAGGYITVGLKLDPTNFPIYIDAGYYFAAKGNIASAKEYFTESMKLFPPDLDVQTLLEEIRLVGSNVGNPTVFNDLADWYAQTKRASSSRYPTLQEAYASFDHERKPVPVKAKAKEFATRYAEMGWPEMVLAVYSHASSWLLQNGFLSDALEMAQAAYSSYVKNGCRENYDQAGFMYYQLQEVYSDLGNDERVVQYANEVIGLSPKLVIHVNDVKSLIILAGSYDRLGKNDEARSFAQAAYKLAENNGYKHGLVSAANSMCASFTFNRFEGDIATSIQYGEAALRLALQYKLETLTGTVISNLALGYLKSGTTEGVSRCLQLHGSLVKIYKDKKEYGQAALTLNNAGSIFFSTGEYAYAARLFEESISLGEMSTAGLSYADKLTFYQSQISAYQFLTACYAQLKDAEKAFEMMEGSRSRVLVERLSKGKQYSKATLADLQANLQPDEACILYSLFSGHEVIILVVTQKSAQVQFYADNSFIGDIKDKYLDRMNKEHGDRKGLGADEPYDPDRKVQLSDFHKVTQLTRRFFEKPGMADNILDEYLRGYYRFLILPVSNRLAGVKKLLISADDVLNYIPFEALKMHDGKYLVEKYDIRYLHSVSVLKQLQNRKYASNRKPLLAMGGAVFQPMTAEASVIESQQDLNRLQLQVEENRREKKSQRSIYATLFGTGALNYLPGTVEEVKNVAAIVPGAEVFLGENMTENRIKALSSNGQLNQYKILHLATHGFVVNEIPDLSGIAMSIFTNEEGGEDGFLNTDEIANLQLNADLTILSACQTALGKIYSGEGVTGLTQSLILAGSNAALVSLWPVNDTSTMLFMSGLYRETIKGNSYSQVVNALTRRFIKGEFGDQFRHPNFWAPFVYIGQ